MDNIRGVFPLRSKIVLASKSSIKLKAVSEFFNIPEEDILCISTDKCTLPEQPYNSGIECCYKRIRYVSDILRTSNYKTKDYDSNRETPLYIIAIENMITDGFDVSCTAIYNNIDKKTIYAQSKGIVFEYKYFEILNRKTTYIYNGADGFSITLGQIIHQENKDINPVDWMSNTEYNLNVLTTGYTCRKDQIIGAFMNLFPYKNTIKELKENIAIIPNFPKKGVMFKNLGNILKNPTLFDKLVKLSVSIIEQYFGFEYNDLRGYKLEIDKIAGLDSRGYIYGSTIAYELLKGFVMIRKKGKTPCVLPFEKISKSYKTEYSTDTLEILKSDITPGDRVLIVDDLCASGGSFYCAKKLVQKAGGVVVGFLSILQVEELKDIARKTLGDTPLIVVL